ncbi:MAG TPA: redoxin domain-containing protein [Terriglobales bacterium]|nr:redoxin domain-containing protein [Terriglobales bacterium]
MGKFVGHLVFHPMSFGSIRAHIPHHLKDYRGHVVLIDFWEYTCINCIRDFAIVKRWYAKYHPYGFDVIGVHYGEFAIGHNTKNVETAAKRFRLPWPVVSDVNGTFWTEYNTQAWPTRDLISPDGEIVMQVEGERYSELMEQKIRELLAKSHPEVMKIPPEPPEDTFNPECGVSTQETYIGPQYGRGAVENKQRMQRDEVVDFHPDRTPTDGGVILSSKWKGGTDGAISAARGASADLQYHARSVYAVLSLDTKKPVRVDVTQDGKPLDAADAGLDIKFDTNGSYLEVNEPRMYFVIKNPEFGSHLLSLSAEDHGVDLHSYTFGNNCQQDFEKSVVFTANQDK